MIAEVEDFPIVFLQIIYTALHYCGKYQDDLRAIDIWIDEVTYTGRGFGREMMRLAVERCFADKMLSAVLVDSMASNTQARLFYEKIGFHLGPVINLAK